MPLCFLAPSGSGVLTHPRQADQAICFPGLCAEKRCSFLRTLSQNPNVKPKASLPCYLPAGLVGTVGSAAGGGGQHAQPSRPFLLAGGLHCRHLQRFPGFLLAHRPSAKGGFSAGSASFQQDHSVLTDNSPPPPPPFKNRLLYRLLLCCFRSSW